MSAMAPREEPPIPKGDRGFRARFSDRLESPLPTTGDMLKIFASGGFSKPAEQRPLAERVPRVAPGAGIPDPKGPMPQVTWVGHASTVIRLAGLTFLTDPVWAETIGGGVRRLTPPGVAWEALPKVDALLVSHNHYDHLNWETVRRIPRDTPCFVPAGLARWLLGKGFTDVTELDWWESVPFRGVELAFVPARHWSRRTPFDTNESLWGGWVLTPASGVGRTYFAGDSGYSPCFREVGKRFPGIDVALIPIGAYEPRWFMRSVHMNPEEAVQAFVDVGARHFVPIHWGTFVLTREPFSEPPERLRAEWARRGLQRERLWDLALGESRGG